MWLKPFFLSDFNPSDESDSIKNENKIIQHFVFHIAVHFSERFDRPNDFGVLTPFENISTQL